MLTAIGSAQQGIGPDPAVALRAARTAQTEWSSTPVRRRLQVVRGLRHRLAEDPLALAATVTLPQRTGAAETLTAEVLPLLEACRFLEREAAGLLAPQRPGSRRRPLWLMGSGLEIHREPHGVVLVIGPSNYPILLPGVQVVQALVAGNAVLVKPGPGGGDAIVRLAAELEASGLPGGLLHVLSDDPADATAAIDAGVDLVVLTGSHDTGRAVLQRLADTVTPSIMELSGCDAAVVLDDADLDLTARALAFGLTFNSSFTCIAPRRAIVHRSRAAELERRLTEELDTAGSVPLPPHVARRLAKLVDDAIADGARIVTGSPPDGDAMAPLVLADVPPDAELLGTDVPAPVLSIVNAADDDELVARAAACPYRLGASVFGSPDHATAVARRLPVGVVVVNDMIVPTADPRLPFGGRGSSGFGTTRGAEGLLELTTPKAVVRRRGRFRPHFDPVGPGDERMFDAFIRLLHAPTLAQRARALHDVMTAGRRRTRRDRRVREER